MISFKTDVVYKPNAVIVTGDKPKIEAEYVRDEETGDLTVTVDEDFEPNDFILLELTQCGSRYNGRLVKNEDKLILQT